jgi:hypothetical protein
MEPMSSGGFEVDRALPAIVTIEEATITFDISVDFYN